MTCLLNKDPDFGLVGPWFARHVKPVSVSRNDSLKMFLSDYLKVLDIYYVSFVVKSC